MEKLSASKLFSFFAGVVAPVINLYIRIYSQILVKISNGSNYRVFRAMGETVPLS
jgi:hypothetical protein